MQRNQVIQVGNWVGFMATLSSIDYWFYYSTHLFMTFMMKMQLSDTPERRHRRR